jgi:3-methyladenine DNA glycosylase Mpg
MDNKKENHATEILKQKMILQNGLRQQNITSTERVGIQPRGRKD